MSAADLTYEPAPLRFRMSREADGAIVAREERDRIGGVFAGLREATDFARREGAYRKRPVELKFDESLALIRAAR